MCTCAAFWPYNIYCINIVVPRVHLLSMSFKYSVLIIFHQTENPPKSSFWNIYKCVFGMLLSTQRDTMHIHATLLAPIGLFHWWCSAMQSHPKAAKYYFIVIPKINNFENTNKQIVHRHLFSWISTHIFRYFISPLFSAIWEYFIFVLSCCLSVFLFGE